MARHPEVRLRWHRTELDNRRVTYADAGEGEVVVFLHGWGLSARSYAPALRLIAQHGARVVAPALPGFGRSDALQGSYTFPNVTSWVVDLLDHVGIDDPVALVGHSFGGAVATSLAWHHPERVRSLVLVNSIGGSVWKDGRRGERLLAERPWWDWGLRLPVEFRRRTYRKVLPVVLRDLVGNALSNPRAVLRAAELARRADLRAELTTLARRGLPVSILWGSEDKVVPEATFLAMCDAAGASGDIVEEAGHAWILADPRGFGELVTNSLAVERTMSTRAREGAARHDPHEDREVRT